MRRLLALLCLFLFVSAAHAAGWSRFIAADKSFSFHYPSGWTARSDGSVIEVNSPQGQEQLLIIALPFGKTKTPRQLTENMLDLLRKQAPTLRAEGWSEGDGGSNIVCEIAYPEEGEDFRGEVVTIKGDDSAHWFSYSAPAAGYYRGRGLALLQGLIGSISAGTGSQPPAAAPPSPLEGTARAFLFVLEFSLGFPFTAEQERLVRDELLAGWSRASAEELKAYDAYPGYASAITLLDQKQVATMQQELAKTTREWLQSAPPDDPVVAMINKQLAAKGKTVVAGKPPLTAMAMRAYAELMAYAELLARQPGAGVEQVQGSEVQEIETALRGEWPKLTAEQREQVAGTPGLWLVLRSEMEQGTAEDRQQVRRMLARLAPQPVAAPKPATGAKPTGSTKPSGSSGGQSGQKDPVSAMLQHQVLMNIQQQTFNHWQWCMGYKSTPFGF